MGMTNLQTMTMILPLLVASLTKKEPKDMYATVQVCVTRPTSIMPEPYEVMLMFSYAGHAEVSSLVPRPSWVHFKLSFAYSKTAAREGLGMRLVVPPSNRVECSYC